MITFDQKRFLVDIEKRAGTIRRQAQAILAKTEGHAVLEELQPSIEGIVTNTSRILNDVNLLRQTLKR